MVAKKSLLEAKTEVQKALDGFIRQVPSDKAFVEPNENGHLVGILVCGGFRNMSVVERQDKIWAYLKSEVDWDSLTHVSLVHAFDHDEYDERSQHYDFPGGFSETLRLDDDSTR